MIARPRRALACALALGALAGLPARAEEARWVGTWASSQQITEDQNLPPAPGFADTTLRQLIHVSLGGKKLRVRFSNAFGSSALELTGAGIARPAGGGAIVAGSARPLTFRGRTSVTIPAGALFLSDPIDFDLAPLSEIAVTLHLRGAPREVTGHPGSRTTSYLQAGEAVSSAELSGAIRVDHWYFLSGVDVLAPPTAAAVAVLGDSISDGRGSTTNGNDRWPDNLARRLSANRATRELAVLNHGVGGNRLLRDGIGPNGLARLERDVLAQPGVRFLIVLLGINDLGTRVSARERGQSWASAEDLIAGYEQIVERAHGHGIRVFGATILPYRGFASYAAEDGEADRQRVNEWMRTSGRFDGVIDFDKIARDPKEPARLSAAVDGGDHLHPSAAGYKIMADAIDLGLFTDRKRR